MAKRIYVEGYRNRTRDLQIALRSSEHGAIDKVLSRADALELIEDLQEAVDVYDVEEAHARMTSAYGGGR